MKQILRLFIIFVATALPFGAAHAEGEGKLVKVEPQYVCMINNALFSKVQIPVSVGGKTYYGCCPMCKAKLEGSAEARTATDPVSGKPVDKATAIIGAEADGGIHYFENEENLNAYVKK